MTPLIVIGAVKLGVQLALNGIYGLHTDELYYILSGQHPAFGYVTLNSSHPVNRASTKLCAVHRADISFD